MRFLKAAALAAALMFSAVVCLAPAVAVAQDVLVGPAATTPLVEPTLLQEFVSAAVPLLLLALTTIGGIAAQQFTKRTGVQVEAQYRDALQSALRNGVLWALQQAKWLPDQPLPNDLVRQASSYVVSSVPDALKQFGIDISTPEGNAQIKRLLTPHLPIGGQLPTVPAK